MKRLLVILLAMAFWSLPALAGVPPPCEEETVIIKLNLGKGIEEIKIPVAAKDILDLPLLNVADAICREGGPTIGYALVFGFPRNQPLIILLVDHEYNFRALGTMYKNHRIDWIYNDDGCPVRASPEELQALTVKMENEVERRLKEKAC